MAFPTGWVVAATLTIQQSVITGSTTLSNFPLLVTEASMPSALVDADGGSAAQNGGGDLRFSSDLAGSNQLPCEIVSFVTDNNPANARAEIWVKVPSISPTVDTTIYVWRHPSGGQTQPAVTDPYGRNAVWSDEEAVWHGALTDVTGNGHDLSAANGVTNTTGATKIGAAALGDFSSASSHYFDAGTADEIANANTISLRAWIRVPNAVGYKGILSKETINTTRTGLEFYIDSSSVGFFTGVTGALYFDDGATSLASNVYHHCVATFDNSLSGGNKVKLYVNGAAVSVGLFQASSVSDAGSGKPLRIGYARSSYFSGQIDEVRLRLGVLSADWIAAEYANQNNPAAFVVGAVPSSGADLGASNIAGAAPALAAPALSQTHALVGATLAATAASLSTSALAQTHALAASGVTDSAASLSAPAFTQAHVLAAQALTATAAALQSASMAQSHVLAGQDVVLGAALHGAPSIGQTHALGGETLVGASLEASAPLVSLTSSLIADDVDGPAVTFESAALTQAHSLVALTIDLAPCAMGGAVVAQTHSLSVMKIIGAQAALGLAVLTLHGLFQTPDPARIVVIVGQTSRLRSASDLEPRLAQAAHEVRIVHAETEERRA